MTFHIAVLGTDGCGKSTVAAALPRILAAEFNLLCGSAGERFLLVGPDEDHLLPGFHPDGLPLSARLAHLLKRAAKKVVDSPRFYPPVKLAHMILQDHAAWKLGRRYRADVVVSDGNLMLTGIARAANYLRPASRGQDDSETAARPEDLRAVLNKLLQGSPINPQSQPRLPDLRRARLLCRALRLAGIHAGWLPDAVVFLDLSARAALERVLGRGGKRDRHENEQDIAQALQMYRRMLEGFKQYRPEAIVAQVEVDGLSPGETLEQIVRSLRQRLSSQAERRCLPAPLGTTTQLTGTRSLWRKVLNHRYLVRYLVGQCVEGAWREPLFVLSRSGRVFLREGYSAEVMRIIYERYAKPASWSEHVFLKYPLHHAVYDRLQILTRRIEAELRLRLARGRPLTIVTAPSGFAYDLFQPLESIQRSAPDGLRNVRVVACDLDPRGAIQEALTTRAKQLGIGFQFVRGDLTHRTTREQLAAAGPYHLALFVGLSSWLPKSAVLDHGRGLAENLAMGGVLVSDSFTPAAYALSGRYVGYKAHYYSPDEYKVVMDYCGFDGLNAAVESGRDQLNHVMLFRKRSTSTPATT